MTSAVQTILEAREQQSKASQTSMVSTATESSVQTDSHGFVAARDSPPVQAGSLNSHQPSVDMDQVRVCELFAADMP